MKKESKGVEPTSTREPGSEKDCVEDENLVLWDRRRFLASLVVGSAALGELHDLLRSGVRQVFAQNNDPRETWLEPWVWKVGDWPNNALQLRVVENENPVAIVGFGNPGAVLFSYGGQTPGPTIRMRGDETLRIDLLNLLKEDFGTTFIKNFPDPAGGNRPPGLTPADSQAQARSLGNFREDWCLGEHTNGVHSAHVTNLHTHGLHVFPGTNSDGTHSDDVLLRVISQADGRRRQAPGSCSGMRHKEVVGQASYEFHLGNVMGQSGAPHPPGTHWYHPHSHGATHNQVSSGMAGFLIIEGDVDDAINRLFTGNTELPLQEKTGTYDYRERLMLIQRVLNFTISTDPDAPKSQSALKTSATPASPSINGNARAMTIAMRPGAVERWRVLNGSVDNRGYSRFMVLQGKFVVDHVRDDPNVGNIYQLKKDDGTGHTSPVTRQQVEDAKVPGLYQLAFDGVTLVSGQGSSARYAVKNLAQQNAGSQSPLDGPLAANQPNQSMLNNFEACFRDATSIRNAFVRPNELYLSPANRADILFQAPSTAGTYTVLSIGSVLHSDDYQQQLQQAVQGGQESTLVAPPGDVVIAYVEVSGSACPAFDVATEVNNVLAPISVPDYLRPIADTEVQIQQGSPEVGTRSVDVAGNGVAETQSKDVTVAAGQYRTRVVCYTGWGAPGYPLITASDHPAFAQFISRNPDLNKLVYADSGNTQALIVPRVRTMAINEQFDPLFEDGSGQPPSPRKFEPDDPTHPKCFTGYSSGNGSQVWAAEEWVLYNASIPLWGDTTPGQQPDGQFQEHFISYPILRSDGQSRFAQDSNFRIVTKGIDHPFHIHVNPCWVLRIEVPDENGTLCNILDAPRWQDVVSIPRGGRVVFRSRFPDYAGKYVHHCHLLLHEDNGMMHMVETTSDAQAANYVPRDQVASASMTASQVDAVYPFPGGATTPEDRLKVLYRQSMGFVDANPTGQIYPGFPIDPPVLGGGGGVPATAASLKFDGRSTYVICNPYPSFPSSALTLELWARTAIFSKSRGTLFSYATSADADLLRLDYQNEELRPYLAGNFQETNIRLQEQWQHFALTWAASDGELRIYWNGRLIQPTSTAARGSSLGSGGSLVLGRRQTAPGTFDTSSTFEGELAEVRLWSRVLGAQEIQANRSRRLQGNEAGLVGYWPLNDNQGTVATDHGPNGNNGTIHSGQWSGEVPFS